MLFPFQYLSFINFIYYNQLSYLFIILVLFTVIYTYRQTHPMIKQQLNKPNPFKRSYHQYSQNNNNDSQINSHFGSNNNIFPPQQTLQNINHKSYQLAQTFMCPFSESRLRNPVILSDGYSYQSQYVFRLLNPSRFNYINSQASNQFVSSNSSNIPSPVNPLHYLNSSIQIQNKTLKLALQYIENFVEKQRIDFITFRKQAEINQHLMHKDIEQKNEQLFRFQLMVQQKDKQILQLKQKYQKQTSNRIQQPKTADSKRNTKDKQICMNNRIELYKKPRATAQLIDLQMYSIQIQNKYSLQWDLILSYLILQNKQQKQVNPQKKQKKQKRQKLQQQLNPIQIGEQQSSGLQFLQVHNYIAKQKKQQNNGLQKSKSLQFKQIDLKDHQNKAVNFIKNTSTNNQPPNNQFKNNQRQFNQIQNNLSSNNLQQNNQQQNNQQQNHQIQNIQENAINIKVHLQNTWGLLQKLRQNLKQPAKYTIMFNKIKRPQLRKQTKRQIQFLNNKFGSRLKYKQNRYFLRHNEIKIKMSIFTQYDWTMLQQLQLSGCEINDEEMSQFTKKSMIFASLQYLVLSENRIKTIKKEIVNLKRLRYLNLGRSQNELNKLGLQSIQILKNYKKQNKKLKIIYKDVFDNNQQ